MRSVDPLAQALAEGRWKAAEQILMRAAKARRGGVGVLYNLGKVMMEQGKWAPARLWLRRALAAEPGHAHAWFELGRVELQLSDAPAARQAFARVVALDPGDGDARLNLARLALRAGDYAQVSDVLAPLAGSSSEVDAMRVRAAAERRTPEAGALAQALWNGARPGDRAVAMQAITRASKGRLPLDL
ncbi:tetratricopeptide repeat protein [Pseudooceanicola sp. CBS1P-1]|uniref:Tetratricopeptide repeat protein n=1 Tax=Pseudooceanicola albus TaxID=2692189 RepID=A0A6L7G5S6_9RHOB|nr:MULTISPECIES: tetratricopeptide repeat protein [Pseudooceanicola]MBT9383071.1 tetratricopeptide repeat protein [Pseudooceanicola endophyticus]MXN19259.1 tetratricopeptide repeat protein [Pseudooceanicola albus]